MSNQVINYVVGEEKRLTDIVGEAEVLPLLQGAVRAGSVEAVIAATDGSVLWSWQGGSAVAAVAVKLPLYLEGEPVGELLLKGDAGADIYLQGVAGLLREALNTVVNSNLKRMLTSEMHTNLVNMSYQELLDANLKLTASETRYRELAEQLEQLVEERTAALKKAHVRLLQQEKMVSVGQLAAGVAHEINNPLGFVSSNLATLQRYVARFVVMLDHYRALLKSDTVPISLQQQAAEKWQELKLDMVCNDVGNLLAESLEGSARVTKIVSDLKGFSHVDAIAEELVDLNSEIDRTLNVLNHEIPASTEIIREYSPLPGFLCRPALICQVFCNIIQNALQARPDRLRLTVTTTVAEGRIKISFSDNGPGIPTEIRGRIFEPFFTTHEVGSGTGMGLAVVYDIVRQYQGSIEIECPPQGGAIFTLLLPVGRI